MLVTKLYAEFKRYYDNERCPWAPVNANRVFQLAYKSLYPRWKLRISRAEFLAVVYQVLGFGDAKGRGLFHKFNPARYNGQLPLEDHFVNLFRKLLFLRLHDYRRQQTGRKRRSRKSSNRMVMEVQLTNWSEVVSRDVDFDRHEIFEEARAALDDAEWAVIHRVYWDNNSFREIGRELGVDHKTVSRRHDEALEKLRKVLCIDLASEIFPNSFPNQRFDARVANCSFCLVT